MKAMDILKMMALPMAAATMMLAVSCTREKLADPQDGGGGSFHEGGL